MRRNQRIITGNLSNNLYRNKRSSEHSSASGFEKRPLSQQRFGRLYNLDDNGTMKQVRQVVLSHAASPESPKSPNLVDRS